MKFRTLFGLTAAASILAGFGVAGTLIFWPAALPAVIGFSVFGVTPFASLASLSFPAAVSVLTAAGAGLAGALTATTGLVAKGFSAGFSALKNWFGGSKNETVFEVEENYSSTSNPLAKMGFNPERQEEPKSISKTASKPVSEEKSQEKSQEEVYEFVPTM